MAIQIRTSVANHPEYWDMGFHEHPDIELSTVFQGKGQFWCDSHCVPIFPGSVVLIPPRIPHRYTSTTAIRFGVIHADGLPKPLLHEFYDLMTANEPEVLHLAQADVQLYESMFRDWLRTASRSNSDRNQATLGAWLRLFVSFVGEQSRHADFPLSIESAANYMQANIHQELHMNDVARQFGMGASTFRRLFRASYGMSPKQYYQMCRIEEAAWRLRTTDCSIQDVAKAVGFDSLHGFSAWFTDMTGMAPTQWRRAEQMGRMTGDPSTVREH